MAELVSRKLTDSGLYVLNIVDAFPNAKLVKAVIKTLGKVFPEVSIYLDKVPGHATRVTYVISASHKYASPDVIRSRRGIPRQWLNVTEPILMTGTPLEQLPLLTDDKVPVERLMASLFVTRLGK